MNALLLAAAMKIAVLQLSATGVDKSLADNLSEVMLSSIHDLGRYAALGKADIDAMLGFEAQRQLLGCSDESASCLAELGGALGVEKIVAGSVGRIDDDFLLTVRIVDIRRGRVDASQMETVSGKASQLIAVMRRVIPALFAKMEGAASPPAVAAAPVTPAPAVVPAPSPAPPASPPAPTVTEPAAPSVPAAALAPVAPPPPSTRDETHLIGWIGAGAAAVGLGMGGVGYAMRQGALKTYRATIVPAEAADARGAAERGQAMFVSGIVMVGVGAVAAGLGFTIF